MDLFDRKGIRPMLLTEDHMPTESSDYLCELKLDGIRCIAYLSDHADLRNKRDVQLIRAFPELEGIYRQAPHRCILDGELIITSADGAPDFEAVQARSMMTDPARIRLAAARRPASLVAFDILYCDGEEIMNRPLTERKEILMDAFTESERLVRSRIFENSAALFDLTARQGLEGIVQKRKNSLYHPGKRSRDWIKVKNLIDEDFVACGYIPKGDLCSLVLGQYDGGRLVYQGHVTLGVSIRDAMQFSTGASCPFDHVPDGSEMVRWYDRMQVCVVRYMERTSKGGLRQPRLRGFRTDKSAVECVVK